mmetsp:Transcript_30097/g.78991  ORF Transcript_30097/g.78991 Transcript_30097/m.78991 type:complete len:133 (-) Transcript_30097:148-546(-)
MAGWGRAIQTMQQVIKIGSAEIVMTHNRNIPMLMSTLNDVLLNSNLDGQIKSVFPGVKQHVRKTKAVFNCKVHGTTPTGLRLLARQYNNHQEVFVTTSYTEEEMQYVLDVAMGKYTHREGVPELDALCAKRT